MAVLRPRASGDAQVTRHPLRSLSRRFDAVQCRRQGVYEYCDAPDCVLRLQLTHRHHALEFGDISVAVGQPVIEIHLWNEHLPVAPAGGPDPGYGLGIQRAFIGSLRALARRTKCDPALADVCAVGGVCALISPHTHLAGVRLMERMGFTVRPYYRPLGRFGEFWANFYSWWIIWTYNPASLRGRRLDRLERMEIWMQADDFLHRYG